MPDHVLLPAEYDKVVSQLKKRGEKGHMILALNEVSRWLLLDWALQTRPQQLLPRASSA